MCPSPYPTTEHSRLTVGIITYNSAKHIARCLDSIATQLADAIPTVVVLDNASSDSTLEVVSAVRKAFPFSLEIIPQSSNHGYAWGANRILERARTDWLCLINPDARLLAPAFTHAREMARRFPTCGVIGGIIVDADGIPQECGGVFPTPLMAVWDWCGLRHVFPRRKWTTTLKLNLPPDRPPRRIDYPTGAFWIFRREIYRRVGPFDERFFLYFEETDFCKRARENGWPAYIHPAIRVEHQRGASFDASPNHHRRDPLSIYFESLVKYLYKHFPARRVDRSLALITSALRFRRWARKDAKSDRILNAFSEARKKTTGVDGDDAT